MPRFMFCLLLLWSFGLLSPARLAARQPSPKREFRAAWVATIGNIDWPQKQNAPPEEQRQEFIRRLDQLKRLGCNAIILQIRPAADAFYPSAIEPWSHYLTGHQGAPPVPFYDPLQFMVEETHKRQMEFHAWFNPFRALVDSRKNPNPPSHVTHLHPDWVVSYGGKSYLNPGIPAAREYVQDVIADVVKRYDIDAVHLDDYFYPYRIAGVPFNDAKAYAAFANGIMDKEEWRRNNINLFISTLNSRIKVLKPYVKLGISPFGVWRNHSKDTLGSYTRGGQTDYDDLYADVRLWMQKGWIDYALPQLYWEHGHRAAPFEVLMPWWRDHAYGRQVYFGLGMYRMLGFPVGKWAGTHELLSQIADIRNDAPGTGFALYSLSNLDKMLAPLEDSLEETDRSIALPPPMKWLDSIPPAAPVVTLFPSAQGAFLQWKIANPAGEPLCYAVYRFPKGAAINTDLSANIISLTSKPEYVDADNSGNAFTYVVTALDRLWNESRISNAVSTGR